MPHTFLIATFSDRAAQSIDAGFPDSLILMFITHATYNGASAFHLESY
jgi:hypothetical protein